MHEATHTMNSIRPLRRGHQQIVISAHSTHRRNVTQPLRLQGYEPTGYECGCRTCDRVFSSEEAFDLHRVGDYSEGRKCADNPATQGLTLTSRGIWQRDRRSQSVRGES